jgi:hypothetical protein
MDFFYRIFGALAASESQGGKHQAGQRVGAHGPTRAQPAARTAWRRARVVAYVADGEENKNAAGLGIKKEIKEI